MIRQVSFRELATIFAAVLAIGFGTSHIDAQVSPEETVKSFELGDGLEASVWAAEPMLVNPTNIDIDARGRVWVCEGANYRTVVTRPEGDRILILEDTDHDGKADSQKVFVQDTKLKSPLGVCVIGNKVYVSLSPNILVYTIDESGDKPVGPPDVWMTGFEGAEHDHGVHALVFGPDGRIYFNSGNAGTDVKEPFKWGNGKPVVDSTGSDVPRGPKWRGGERPKGELGYQEGMAFRCNADGTGFETLGYNFRNNYELAVDSFGTVWQSDNDDDGNEGVRLNYVMEGGNFGYHGPQGHDWNRDLAAFPGQSRQEAHWHQRWPGVVPNMIHTGGGSPTGIVLYEGELLPEKFRGAIIHCDAGTNSVRAYIPTPSEQVPVKKFTEADAMKGPDRPGAGYKVEVVDFIKGKDKWFRPSDVCVAPDGSLLVADWYDPGVGGHQTADLKKDEPLDWRKLHGRIYRITPKGNKSAAMPELNLSNVEGQILALKSPNLATRALAFAKLKSGGAAAEKALLALANGKEAPRYRARAVWLLAQGPHPKEDLNGPLHSKDLNVFITALRAARLAGADLSMLAAEQFKDDVPPGVLRELALAMNYQPAETAVPMLVKLANRFDGEDRWYLEALGIGATGKEQAVLDAWEKSGTNKEAKAGELIRWRLKKELPAQVRLDEKTQIIEHWWALAPFDGPANSAIRKEMPPEESLTRIDVNRAYDGVDGKPAKWTRVDAVPYEGAVAGLKWVDFRAFLDRRGPRGERVVGFLATSVVSPTDQPGKLMVSVNDFCRLWINGKEVLSQEHTRDVRFPDETIPVEFRRGENTIFVKIFQRYGTSGLLVAAIGERARLSMPTDVPPGHAADAVAGTGTPVSATAPAGPVAKDGSPLPSIDELAKQIGDPKAGEAVFANASGANCIACHQIADKGQMLGPPLTTVGQKLSKAQLYEAILKPSAGILMGFENWVVRTKKGETISGLKTSDTPDAITIKDIQGKYHDLAPNDIARQVKQKISIMPENLSQTMTRKELIDLVEYLSTLRNK